ncbi:MAG: hypothetical protein ABII12_02820 [Planctomycetota bacterium]
MGRPLKIDVSEKTRELLAGVFFLLILGAVIGLVTLIQWRHL